MLGFINNNPALRYMSLHGFEVLGGRNVLPKVVARYGHIDGIVITISAVSSRKAAGFEIVELCRQRSPNVQVAPSLDELFMGKVDSFSDLRDVHIRALIGRESAKVGISTKDDLKTFFERQNNLVTGVRGSSRSELCFEYAEIPATKNHPPRAGQEQHALRDGDAACCLTATASSWRK